MFQVILTGGSSGGHLFPLISVAEELIALSRERQIPLRLSYVGGAPFANDDLERLGIEVKVLPVVKLRRYFSGRNFIDALKLPLEALSAFLAVFSLLPDAVFSKGGPGSIFVVIFGRLFGAKVFIHESDSIPGRANLLASKFAKQIFTSFESAAQHFKKNVVLVGNPLPFRWLQATLSQDDFYKFGIDQSSETILILGGSQGAQRINEFILMRLPQLVRKYQVIHQCGQRNYKETKEMADFILEREVPYRKSYYKLFGFIERPLLFKLLNFSTLVVSRAGGAAIFEVAAAQKPSILIPLTKEVAASDHQTQNAYAYAKTGAAVVLEESNLTAHLFLSLVDSIVGDPQRQQQMSSAAALFARPEAARKIAEVILEFKM